MSRVLLVDDAVGLADLVRAVLRDVEVEQVMDLKAATAAVHEERPAVVLLDLNLGDEDGIDLLDQIVGDESLSGLPVVVFSVHDSRFKEALDKGAVDCLRKPFRTGDLKRVVEPYLAQGAGRPQ